MLLLLLQQDESLKVVTQQLQNLILLIIDEISMASHITLLYIHLRLTEIFQTENTERQQHQLRSVGQRTKDTGYCTTEPSRTILLEHTK